MTTDQATPQKPLWLLMEEQIFQLDPKDLSGESAEASIQRMAGELDQAGFNVSRDGGNMIKLRFAVEKARKAGRALLTDFNAAVSEFTLESVADPCSATTGLLDKMAETWPDIKDPERRPGVIGIVEKKEAGSSGRQSKRDAGR